MGHVGGNVPTFSSVITASSELLWPPEDPLGDGYVLYNPMSWKGPRRNRGTVGSGHPGKWKCYEKEVSGDVKGAGICPQGNRRLKLDLFSKGEKKKVS